MKTLLTRLAHCAVVLALVVLAAGCSTGPHGSTVTVMVPWSGFEFQAFYKVVTQFEKETGIHVDVEVTRALTQQLDAAVAADNPPDLAVLPSVGAVDYYAGIGSLHPLDGGFDTYMEPFRQLMHAGGKVYAVPVKADVKSLYWYDPAFTPRPPSGLPGLESFASSRTTPWCLGLGSGPTSGWPGADWIADIILDEYGSSGYETWLSGSPQWTSSRIEEAWDTWGRLVRRSAADAVGISYGDAAQGMTNRPPTCSVGHGALTAMNFRVRPRLRQGRDYDYVTPDAKSPLQVSADFVGMFTPHNTGAAELIAYLSGKDAQTAWVRAGAEAFSADSDVALSAYPRGVEQRIARLIRPDSGRTLCFSAADTMAPGLSAAFYRAVVNYTDAPDRLPQILAGLDKVQRSENASPVTSHVPSAVPSANICTSSH